MCAIANLSTQTQRFSNAIELPGKIVDANVWKQSQFSIYEHHISVSEIASTKNLREYFDIAFSEEKGKDLLFTNELPAGFGCVIEC